MARGDYTVQEVVAAKQAGRDSSYRTCVLTMFIFLVLCIILLVIAWTTWKPASKKEDYSYQSKYGGKLSTLSLGTEPPFYEFEDLTTMKTHHKEYAYHPVTKTVQGLGTLATTKSHLNRLVALETTDAIKTKNFTSSPATPTSTTTTTTTTTTPITDILLPQPEDSTDFSTATTVTSTENYLKQHILFISSPATTEKSLMKSDQYDMTTTAIKRPLIRLVELTTSTTPVISLETEQPLTTTIEKTSMQMEGISEDISGQETRTETKQMTYTVPHTEKSEQPSSTKSDLPVHRWLSTTTSMLKTDLPEKTPKVIKQEPEKKSTTENPLLKYKRTGFTHTARSAEMTFRTESSEPEDQPTNHFIQWLILGQHSTDTITSSALHGQTDSSFSLAESVTATTIFERDSVSDYSESKIATKKQLMSSSASSIAETEDPIKNLTLSTTEFTNSISSTDSTSVNNQLNFTMNNESTTSDTSTTAVRLTITDRSTAPYNAAVNITVTEDTSPTNLLTSSSILHPHIQPIYTLITTETSTDSTYSTAITSVRDGTDVGSSVSDLSDLSLQTISAVQFTNISRILTTTDEPLHASVTGPKTTAVTNSVTLIQQNPTASDETSMSPSYKSQKIVVNVTVAPEQAKHCATSACKVVASRMLSLMNHSADPCEDFYEYACGGLRENRNILQHDPEYEVWTRIAGAMKQINVHSPAAFRKFNNFYDQCVLFDSIVNKTSRLEEIRKLLHSVGKMYNNTQWTTRNLNLNLTSLLVKLFQLNSAPLFDVQLDVDVHNPSRFSLKLTAPHHQSKFQLESSFAARCKVKIASKDGKNVNLKDVYFNKYLPCTRDYGKYMNVTEKALKELQMFKDLEPFQESQYITVLRFFIEFEILHHLTELPPAAEMRHILLSKKFTSISVNDLQARYSLVNWKTLFSALVGDTVDEHTTIQLYFEGYFYSLFDKLSELFRRDSTNRMNLHNALLAMFAHDLYTDLVQTRSPCSREDYCLRVASGLLEDVSSALYLSTFTREQLNDMELELQTLFTQLKSTLKQQFQEAEWLDDSSRSYLTSKLQQLNAVSDGGRFFLGDFDWLNHRLSYLDKNSSDTYIQNAVELVRRYRSGMYSLYGTEPNVTDTIWSHFLLPYDTQAVAVHQLNIVVIPFGLIGSPQSTPALPAYIFKAQVGNDLARQLAHHFDTIGIEYGSSGKDMDLLSEITKDKYNSIRECYESVYSTENSWTNHKHQIFTYEVDASHIMNEHFADSSALQLSYKTYKRNAGSEPLLPWLDMNHDKLYYMLVAQEFCTKGGLLDYTIQLFESEQIPPILRVTNLAQNSEAFSEAYSCGRGTQMNPENKCNSFPELKDVDAYSSDIPPQ